MMYLRRGVLWTILVMLSASAMANQALDELNALLAKKQTSTALATPNVTSEIKNLSDNYYFVFIYKGTCPHCHNFAPILSDFAKTFKIQIQPYSLDSTPLVEFDAQPLTPELFQTFYVASGYKPAVPALFLVNRHTDEGFAVLFGEATDVELARRVHELVKHIEEKYHA